jgi:hypothetical protein
VVLLAQSQLPVPLQFTEFWPFWKVQVPAEANPVPVEVALPPIMIAICDTKKLEVGPLSVSVAELVPTFKTAL